MGWQRPLHKTGKKTVVSLVLCVYLCIFLLLSLKKSNNKIKYFYHKTKHIAYLIFRWGDVRLRTTADGDECIEFHVRQTQTRTGENLVD